jgi:hypothetical protein
MCPPYSFSCVRTYRYVHSSVKKRYVHSAPPRRLYVHQYHVLLYQLVTTQDKYISAIQINSRYTVGERKIEGKNM